MSPEPKIDGSVLYVEDDDVTRRALGASLERLVARLWMADGGRAGLAAFREHAPDLVITDITMPGMSGLEMAREMRALRADVPILVTTAYNDTAYLLEAIDIGVDGYVLKPVDFDRLFLLVRRNLAMVAAERDRERTLAELRAALAEVKRLSGLIPICAYCKNVRGDAGYWEAVETYVTERSEAWFSHGICPDCCARHFPDEAPPR